MRITADLISKCAAYLMSDLSHLSKMRTNSGLIEPSNLVYSNKLASSVADEDDDGRNIDVYEDSDSVI
jgi:hypothetical protein